MGVVFQIIISLEQRGLVGWLVRWMDGWLVELSASDISMYMNFMSTGYYLMNCIKM